MSQTPYAIGDAVVLKTGYNGVDKNCYIVGLLPAGERGEPQFRIRMDNENFERRVVQSDIDQTASADLDHQPESGPTASEPKPWLTPLSSKARKA